MDVTEQQANRVLEHLKQYVDKKVVAKVAEELPLHVQTDKDFLELILRLEKRLRLLESKA